jgi:hypothetical protein
MSKKSKAYLSGAVTACQEIRRINELNKITARIYGSPFLNLHEII